MNNKKMIALFFAFVVVSTGALVLTSDDSDAATYNARIFIDGEEHQGTGNNLLNVVKSVTGDDLVVAANGNITSYKGEEAPAGYAWVFFKWVPMGDTTVVPAIDWIVVQLTNNSVLDNGASFAIHLSKITTVGGKTTYSIPDFEPQSTAYFFIKFAEQYDNKYVLNLLTEKERRDGFWISGTGSSADEALYEACQRYVFDLTMNMGDGSGGHEAILKGWLGSFMRMGDETIGAPEDSTYRYWSQFTWNGSTWNYNQNALGYFDPGINPYYGIVRQTTLEGSASSGISFNPERLNVPSLVRSANSVWDGEPGGGDDPDPEPEVKPTSITLNTTSLSFFENSGSQKLTATLTPANAIKTVNWTTSNSSVATVDSDGNVTPIREGNAVITATAEGGKTAICSVTVKKQSSPTSFELSASSTTLTINGTVQLYANQSVRSWSSSDTSVATVDSNGRVTGVKAGAAVITATSSSGNTATCLVSVSQGSSGGETSSDIFTGNMSNTAYAVDHDSNSVTSESLVVGSIDESGYVVDDKAIRELITQLDKVKKLASNATMNVIIDGGSSDTVNIANLSSVANAGANIVIRSSSGDVTLTNEILSNISSDSFALDMKGVNPNDLNEEQKEQVGDKDILIGITANSSGSDVHELGGKATVSVKYSIPSGVSVSEISLWYLAEDGTTEKMEFTYRGGYITFETDHFSIFKIGVESGSSGGISTTMIAGIIIAVIAVVVIAVALVWRNKQSASS